MGGTENGVRIIWCLYSPMYGDKFCQLRLLFPRFGTQSARWSTNHEEVEATCSPVHENANIQELWS